MSVWESADDTMDEAKQAKPSCLVVDIAFQLFECQGQFSNAFLVGRLP